MHIADASNIKPGKAHFPPAALFILATLLFGAIPGTLANYGYDYYQFLPDIALLVPFALMGLLFMYMHQGGEPSPTWQHWLGPLGCLAFPILCWFFRTQIHCFGGDGAVAPMVTDGFSWSDWQAPWPTQGRLDGWGSAFVAKCCRVLGIYERSSVLPSILSTQVYGVVMGTIFAAVALLGFRHRLAMMAILLTMPYAFNFFGNTDAYPFSLVVALVMLVLLERELSADANSTPRLSCLIALWGLGIWTHPFHIFWGFLIAYAISRRLPCLHRLQIPNWSLSVIFGIGLFIAIKCSRFGNAWFIWDPQKTPPIFSIPTLIHYLNMVLLPSLPLLAALFLERKRDAFIVHALALFIAASSCFFAMAFTLGVVDQFNYQHLLFFISAPLVIAIARNRLPNQAIAAIVFCNLSLLMPMIAVHSTHQTIKRAEALYPLDHCQHNQHISWQAHLGLCLADNTQEDLEIRRTVLKTFMDGFRNAQPEVRRGGNFVYHTAFLYNYGLFEPARAQLFRVLEQNPKGVGWFLEERPRYIYFNRKRLWSDIDQFLTSKNSPQLERYRERVQELSHQCQERPHHLKRPNYALTEY